MITKEMSLRKWYPIRTCGYKNRKKMSKIITKALQSGAIGSFIGFQMITLRPEASGTIRGLSYLEHD